MASVDDRIVRMEFDNAAFERKVASTITSIGQLEKSLKFDGAKQGLAGVQAEVGKFNLGNMATTIEGISSKFLALSTIAVTALATITSKAISSGIQIAKSLSLDQIITGFKEYELNMNSIQTILANTKADGTNLEQVNAALDELNQYADKTIYNFGQMTKNIGTFTAAGVDLDTSVQSIKGISNLAAISGSSAEQASTAMYQLSQAVSTGTLKLMDWNSVVNAGMGGEVFQKALFETGKTMGTIADVPIGQTFEEWTAAGNSFRGSLQDGWLTSEVLTTTLQGFTGEMTEAQLLAIGYTKEQAAQIMELGKTGVEAATKVRTLTGLIQTTKESIGSGWSESFRIVLGDFEEATELFSTISGLIGDMVGKNADARNEMLQGWDTLGGRKLFFDSLILAAANLWETIKPIKEAFREIFPAATSKSLFEMTQRFAAFAAALKPSTETVENLKRIFKGFFGALEIGWTILKEGAKFVGELFASLTGAGSGDFLAFIANIGDFLTALNDKLVTGGGIADFFDNLSTTISTFFTNVATFLQDRGIIDFFNELKDALKSPAEFAENLKDNLLDLFDNIHSPVIDVASDAFERFGQRFETLKNLFEKAGDIWDTFQDALEEVAGLLDTCWEAIKTWFEELGQKIADVMGPGDFDAAVDAINVGLLGGIAALLAKFIREGFSFDIGSGLFDKIGRSFEELTGVMKAMQTDIKADALMKIAIAIGVLTASVLVLSLIDSEALTKALIAMAVGFGQLMASFAVLNKMSAGPKGAASFAAMATGMILMASAILILSAATAVLASLSWDELARGLTGVTALMTVMTAAAIIMSKNSSSMISAGIGMMFIAVALNILAGAVMIFATMSWEEMGKGFAGVAAGLLIIALAMRLMPEGMALQAVGLMLVATSLGILAGVVKIFATMDWGEMAKGFVGIGAGLLIIAGAMHLMPATMPLIGAGLILVSISLIAIASAMKIMASMSWEEIAKGLVAMAGALLILAIASNAMSGAILGAVAIGIVSVSLMLLVEVLKEMGNLSWSELLMGLAGIAAVLAVLAVAAMLIQPVIPALLGLGVALLVIGAGFALFGLGASLVAEAFERLAKSGAAGAEALVATLGAIGRAMPAFMTGVAEGLLELAQVFIDAAPVLVKGLVEVLGHLLEGLGKLIPQVLELIGDLISGILELIATKYPEFVETGIGLLISLLQGIRDNIGEVVTLVGEIITEFLDAMAEQLSNIVQSVADLIITFFTSVAEAVGRVSATLMFGLAGSFISGFIDGLDDALPGPMKWFTDMAGKVLGWIGDVAKTLWNKGTDFIGGLLGGIINKAIAVTRWFTDLVKKVLGWIGNVARSLWTKGIDFIAGLLGGIVEKAAAVITWFTDLAKSVLGWIGNVARSLWDKGRDFITGLFDGIKNVWTTVTTWLGNMGTRIKNSIGAVASLLFNIGKDIIQGLWNGLKDVWGRVAQWIKDRIEDIPGFLKSMLGMESPSRVMFDLGQFIFIGLANGMKNKSDLPQQATEDMANNIMNTMDQLATDMMNYDEFNPTITPVLDLSLVQAQAGNIAKYIPASSSYVQAQVIASTGTQIPENVITPLAGTGEVRFEQNIYSPTQLSTSDIYKSTRNQIAMAKEELSIP